ncbi:MAG: membrane protein insertase YidC [Oscillospiraceae bacterium]|nr:membrane protein insertase YidC [Oscillospiraceae bacterium]
MILAFSLPDLVQVPFGYLLAFLYQFTSNYGLALILFAFIVKLVLLPASAKSKKSMMKMSRLAPRIQAVKDKYENDQAKQNEAITAIYKEEGVSLGGGCLWSLLPLLLLFPLYTVVREPIEYMLHESTEVAGKIVEIIQKELPELFTSNNSFYAQMIAAPRIPEFAAQIKEAGLAVKDATLEGINFTFLGIDLGVVPAFNVFAESWKWDWAHIGGALVPLLSCGSQFLSMLLSQKSNNSVVTNEKGIQDKETAKKSQSAQQSKMMMWMMPLMSLWIGFTVPGALSLYWLAQGVVTAVSDFILTQKYRKIYDAEDAVRLQKAMEEEAIEAEKERVRAERRAANPDGITTNTSKKKMQQAKQKEQEEAKAAAAKEYAAKKGIVIEEAKESAAPMSGVEDRPFCKGRAYDAHRYDTQSTEE